MNPPDCQTCANRYPGADGVDYCRTDNALFGMKCSLAAADGCKRYEPNEYAGLVFMGDGIGWCVTSSSEGRGD